MVLTLLAGLSDTLPVVRVNDEDDTLGVLEVCVALVWRYKAKTAWVRACIRTVPPEGTDLVLTSDVPDGERNVLVLDSLDVEAWGVLVECLVDGRRGESRP